MVNLSSFIGVPFKSAISVVVMPVTEIELRFIAR